MSLNQNHDIRCRESLKPYYQQRVKFMGYLKAIGINQDPLEKMNGDHNALFLDVHGVCVVKDNPADQRAIEVDIDHIHCQIKNRHLDHYLDQFITFSAKVDRYESTHDYHKEWRYGLTDLTIENNDPKGLHWINQQYKKSLTTYQGMILNHIVKYIPRIYTKRRMFSIEELKKSLLHFNSFNDRTNFLIHTAETLNDRLPNDNDPLSSRKVKFFTEDPDDHNRFNMNRYQNLKQTYSKLKRSLEKSESKRINQKLQYQNQIERYQKIMEQQVNQIRFYQTREKYFTPPNQRHHQSDEPTVASDDQLQQLKDQFDRNTNN